MAKKAKKDVYQIITEKMLAQLEKGCVPWQKPWKSASEWPCNFVTGKKYRGLNVFSLHMEAYVKGYSSPYWLTFKQAKAKGGSVRKGEKGSMVVFWKRVEKEKEKELPNGDTEMVDDSYFLLRYYTVFNVEQCEGLEVPVVEDPVEFNSIEACEHVVDKMPKKPEIKHGGGRACYIPSKDEIHMPKAGDFNGAPEYYSTLFHELTHCTGHESRLNRESIVDLQPFGTTNYSKEELIAEMGAAFLCGETGIENATIDNSAAYIQNWVKEFKDKPKMLVCAAAAAQKAVDFILDRKFEND